MTEQTLADVLAEHEFDVQYAPNGREICRCSCGDAVRPSDRYAHLAEHVREWALSEAQELAAAKAVWERRRLDWESVRQGECIIDAREALNALPWGVS